MSPTTLTTPNENDIKGAPNGDDHDAKFDTRPKWPFWIGISGRFRRNAQFELLAQNREMLVRHCQLEEFIERIIGPLDAHQVWDELYALVAPEIPILMCFEKPPLGAPGHPNWCHRNLVANWLREELGKDVSELDSEDNLGW